jgi:hypothetical protein
MNVRVPSADERAAGAPASTTAAFHNGQEV